MATITGIGPCAITGRPSAFSGTLTGTKTGQYTIYNYPTCKTLNDVTVYGTSMKNFGVMEIGIMDSGYGYVLTTKNPSNGEETILPDGSSLLYTNYGYIEIQQA